jgi:nucleoside-diphosphate-sugar epimerase
MARSNHALLTGAGGYVGRHLARRLLTEGWTVTALVRANSTRPLAPGLAERVAVHRDDGDVGTLVAALGAAKPDVVFHLASLFVAEHKPEQVAALVESNIGFGTRLLEAMAEAGATRLVNTGTAWQHFDGDAYNPSSLYAASKQAFEAMLRFYVEARGLKAITLKLFDTYGPEDERPKLIPALLRAVQAGTPLQMTPGENRLDFVHIDDVTSAYLIAARRLLDGAAADETYAVRSGQAVSLRELVAMVERATGAKLAVTWGGRPYRAREIMAPWAGGTTLPGWTAAIPLQQGLTALATR